MPAKPKKAKAPAIETVSELHTTIDRIAVLEVRIRKLAAVRDEAIQQVTAIHDGQIEADKAEQKSLVSLASTFAKAHRELVFGSKLKSAATTLARFGFREGKDSLKPLSKKFTWEKILESLKELKKYVRTVTKEEVDKEALHAAKLTDAQLAELGLRMDKDETFFVESKAEDADRVTGDAHAEAA
jgi:phage host-nuclease inhibitor protein Gam